MKKTEEKHFTKKKDILINSLELIKKYHELTDDFCNMLETLGGHGSYCDAFIYTEYEAAVIDLLKCVFQIPEEDDILEWYIYDTNFGNDTKPEIISEGKTYILDSIENLYNYLIDTYYW